MTSSEKVTNPQMLGALIPALPLAAGRSSLSVFTKGKNSSAGRMIEAFLAWVVPGFGRLMWVGQSSLQTETMLHLVPGFVLVQESGSDDRKVAGLRI